MKKFRDIARKGQALVDDVHRILNHGRLVVSLIAAELAARGP